MKCFIARQCKLIANWTEIKSREQKQSNTSITHLNGIETHKLDHATSIKQDGN